MENNLKLEVTGNELIIREGKAPEIIKLIGNVINGTIKAPGDYYLSKIKANKEYRLDSCLLTIDRDNKKLILDLNDNNDSYKEVITGSLAMDTELKAFNINNGKRVSAKQLGDFIKMNRVHFIDRDAHIALLKNLKSFKAKVDQVIEDSDDSKGNKVQHYAQTLTTDINLDFILEIPIFKGLEKKKFKVEINFDVRDGGIDLWLESVELKELMDSLRDDILNEEINRLSAIPNLEI